MANLCVSLTFFPLNITDLWHSKVYESLFYFIPQQFRADKVTDWNFHTVTNKLTMHSIFNTFSEWMLRGLRHKGQLVWFNSTTKSLKNVRHCSLGRGNGGGWTIANPLSLWETTQWIGQTFIFIWIWSYMSTVLVIWVGKNAEDQRTIQA